MNCHFLPKGKRSPLQSQLTLRAQRYTEKLLWQPCSLKLLPSPFWGERIPFTLTQEIFLCWPLRLKGTWFVFTVTGYPGSQPIPSMPARGFRPFSFYSKEHPHSEPCSPKACPIYPLPKVFLEGGVPTDSDTILFITCNEFSASSSAEGPGWGWVHTAQQCCAAVLWLSSRTQKAPPNQSYIAPKASPVAALRAGLCCASIHHFSWCSTPLTNLSLTTLKNNKQTKYKEESLFRLVKGSVVFPPPSWFLDFFLKRNLW